jgi:hypothetical protein
MKSQLINTFLILFFLCRYTASYGQTTNKQDYLLSFVDTVKDEYGYKNLRGEIVIPLGKYAICYTDTFRTYAIVLKSKYGFVTIDRNEKILYQVYPFDNGPDYTSDGYFRIIENNKIGFADSATGKIIIKPQFDCAFPFEKNIAKVSNNCKTQADGEHEMWLSDNWYYIDKKGNKVNKQKTKAK